MNPWLAVYDLAALPLARAAVRLMAPWRPKVKRGLAGRKESFPELEAFLARRGDSARGGVLFHAPSVGEFLQALPLLEELKRRDPARPLLLVLLPLGRAPGPRLQVPGPGVLPARGHPGQHGAAAGADPPRLIVVSKFDIWPALVRAAHARGIPTAVIAATLSPDSGRLKGLSAAFHRSFYPLLDLVCAISAEDAANFVRLGVDPQRCLVTGDTRFDQTWACAIRWVSITRRSGCSAPGMA